MPRLFALGASPQPPTVVGLPPDRAAARVLTAAPGRWEGMALPAQLLALAPTGLDLRELP